jgi:SAM-dependent methyltransferase
MRRPKLVNKFHVFIETAFKEGKLNKTNIKLLLKSLYLSIKFFIKRERNVSSEIYSYESLFLVKLKDPVAFLESCRRNDNAFPAGIIGEVKNLKNQVFNVETLKTLEIGSGPNSNLSYWVDNKLLEVTAIDPLAEVYAKIMKKLNYKYPITPIKLDGEDLLEHFKKESFHIIFAQNSLDHVEDPIKCFNNAYYLLKKGGFLFVCSNIKEGTRKSWTGMHKYDIYVENNELILSTQSGEEIRFINNHVFLEFIYYEEYNIRNIKSFEAVFRKIK